LRRPEGPEIAVLLADQRIARRAGDVRLDIDLGRASRDPLDDHLGFGRIDRLDAGFDEPIGRRHFARA
jgi:hypothetical protein